MNSLEYITIFKNLLHTINLLTKNSIKPELKEKILPIINTIMSDTLEFLTVYKKNCYTIPEYERGEIQYRLHSHQKQLDELVEHLSIVKECSKCKGIFPATTRYFYTNISTKEGLRPECKKCHSNAKKEFYKKNKHLH
ncbi:MAG: hypothetical protein ACFFFT_03750 [Candidatus Thorarchaeota archaeon]